MRELDTLERVGSVLVVASLLYSTAFSTVASSILAIGQSFPQSTSLGEMLVDLFAVKRGWMHPHILIIFGCSFLLGFGIALLTTDRRRRVNEGILYLAIPMSIASYGILLLPPEDPTPTSALGRVMSADLSLMIMLQLGLFAAGVLDVWGVVAGPTGAIAMLAPSEGHLHISGASAIRSLLLVGALLPALYRERNERLSVTDLTTHFNPLEAYATFQVTASVIVLTLTYVPRIALDAREMSLAGVLQRFVVLLLIVAFANHNVAATWALTGCVRGRDE